MSLFRARELWNINVGNAEVFDYGALCVSNIDNNSEANERIIVGSQNGILRIYSPHAGRNDDGSYVGYKADDLLLEVQLNQPILQLAVGHFIGSSSENHLAVLHPRKLIVYSVTSVAGTAEHGTQYQLIAAYDHSLQRSAYSLVVGPFGGVKGRDFLCVQSLDGTVCFFEQESFAFCRFLPNFLLPGPMKYVKRTDSFVTSSSSYLLECYKYQVLAVAADSKTKEESQNIRQGKKVSVDWSFNLGEGVVAIVVTNFRNVIPSILVLGERHIFCLKDSGSIVFVIKLDYNPSAFFPYQASADGSLMYMVTTHTKSLLVYKGVTLQWVAQIPVVPVMVNRLTVSDVKGSICLLSDEGELMCMYLGTDPSLFSSPVVESSSIDYKETDLELKKLYKIIKSSQMPSGLESKDNKSRNSFLKLDVVIDTNLSPLPDYVPVQNREGIHCISLQIKVTPSTYLKNVRVSVNVQKPLEASQRVSDFKSLGQEVDLTSLIYAKYDFVPSSLSADVVVVYTIDNDAPRVECKSVDLPLSLVARPTAPIKDAAHKITIDVNQSSLPTPGKLFSEFVFDTDNKAGNSIGFEYVSRHEVSVLLSTSSNKYRIQSGCFEAIWIVLQQTIKRLARHFQLDADARYKILSYQSQLPLQECFRNIDSHYAKRTSCQQFQDRLTQAATQFRAIQKRLLTKMKDKTPTPLTNLDILLESTYQKIVELADQVEDGEKEIERAGCSLGCSLSILIELITIQSSLNDEQRRLLHAALLSSQACSLNDQVGWEEMADCAVNYLLKNRMNKSGTEQGAVQSNQLAFPKNTSSIKKRIGQLVERITSNTEKLRLVDGSQTREPKLCVVPTSTEGDLEKSLKSSLDRAPVEIPADRDSKNSEEIMEEKSRVSPTDILK